MKKIVVLCLIALFLVFSACRGRHDIEELYDGGNELPDVAAVDNIHRITLFDLPAGFAEVRQFAVADGQIFVAAMAQGASAAQLVSVDMAGAVQVQTEIPLPDSRGFLIGPRVGQTGEVVFLAQTYSGMDANGVRTEYQASLVRMDGGGTLIDIVVLADIDGDVLLSDMQVGADGMIYLLRLDEGQDGAMTTVLVYDADGTPYGAMSIDWWAHALISVDGMIYMGGWGEVIYPVGAMPLQIGEPVERHVYSLTHSSADGLLYYTDDLHLYSQDLTANIVQRELNFMDVGISPEQVQWLEVTAEGDIVLLLTGNRIAILTQISPEEAPTRTDLTLASASPGADLEAEIARFNLMHEDYRITLVDYSVYNTHDDWTAGHRRLREDILAGEVFDLIDLSGLSVESLTTHGLLRDLYTIIDGTRALVREDIHPNVRGALEVNGALYAMPASFYLMTLGGGAEAQELAGWDVEAFLAYAESLPTGTSAIWPTVDRFALLQIFTMLNWSELVDFTRGEAHFDADWFVSFLEYTAQFGMTEEALDTEREGLEILHITRFQEIPLYDAMFDGVHFIGFPSNAGHAHGFGFGRSIGISSESDAPLGAWAFIHQFLQREPGQSWGFPVLWRDLEAEMAYVRTSEEVESWGIGGLIVEIGAVSEEDTQRVLDLIAATHTVAQHDELVWEIIASEAERFYLGEQSARAAVTGINRRVQELMG